MEEVAKHDSRQRGIWVAINGQVYDVTAFIDKHPGGAGIIERNAGKDVSEIYTPVHPRNAIQDNLTQEQHVGLVDPATVKTTDDVDLTPRELRRRRALANLPAVGSLLNLDDFERVARRILTDQAWAYYTSAADDEVTKHNNRSAYARVWFKPRILRDVGQVDCSSDMLGVKVDVPVYVSPAAMAKLGHPDGELNLTRAAAAGNIIQGISANASVSLDEMLEARAKGQSLIYQLYVNRDRRASEKILNKIQELPKGVMAAVMLTVDAPVMGNRESDARAKGEVVQTAGDTRSEAKPGGGVGVAISGYIDPTLTWDVIGWYKKHCSLPLILKGVASVQDVELAVKHGCRAVVLSNHGGRSLEYAPAPIDVLIELHQQRPDLLTKIDVFIDGGVRRGTDVLKALALGAKGVGLGRPFLYAQSGYGEQGARRAIQIIREEVERGMRLLGINSLKQLTPDMIDILPRSFDPYLLHRQAERRREYVFEHEQDEAEQ
jgi:isopentenyl diphosphate isomerase/L-lactate dehydrogenase-like FMN-dependent dehydrogenase/predicted heme/steroid binding protein